MALVRIQNSGCDTTSTLAAQTLQPVKALPKPSTFAGFL